MKIDDAYIIDEVEYSVDSEPFPCMHSSIQDNHLLHSVVYAKLNKIDNQRCFFWKILVKS